MKIANAFSLNMVQMPAKISCSKITVEQIKEEILGECILVGGELGAELPQECVDTSGWCEKCKNRVPKGINALESVIGHADTAKIVSRLLFDCKRCAPVGSLDNPDYKVPVDCAASGCNCDKCENWTSNYELPANRASVKLEPGEKMIVAQYSGPRLPEGTTALPEGAKIEFILVEVS